MHLNVCRYAWDNGGLNGNPNTTAERLVDEKGRAMLTYSVRRPSSAAAAPRTSTLQRGRNGGVNALANFPVSAAPQQATACASDATVHGRPASARSNAATASGRMKSEMGGLVNRTWELAMEQQSGGRAGRSSRSSSSLLALGKTGNAMADTHSLLGSFVQEATSSTSLPSSGVNGNVGYSTERLHYQNTRRPSSAAAAEQLSGAGANTMSRGQFELDSSLTRRSAFSLGDDDTSSRTKFNASAERSRRRQQQRSRHQRSRRPASAGSLRAAVGSWGELRGRGVLTQLTRARSSSGVPGSSNTGVGKSAWDWEDDLSALQRQSRRYAGAEITLD